MATSTSWAQDVITCDLCDKPTQQFCNNCQVNLCDNCVKKHRDEFKSLMHEIVPFLERKIQLVFPECSEHSGQRCELNCKKCNKPVCIKCIASGPHKGHDVEELTETHENKIRKIKSDTEEIRTKIIPKYQNEDHRIGNIISTTKLKIDDLGKESKELRKLWHQEVDNIFDKIDSLRQSLGEENLSALQGYHNKIRNLISEINTAVQQNEKLSISTNSLEVNKYQSKLNEYHDFPKYVHLKFPLLGSDIDKGKELSIEIGGFKATLKQMSQPSLSTDVSHLTTGIGKLMDKIRVIATIPTTYIPLYGIACVEEVEAWIYGNNKTITRIDIHGAVKDTVTTTCRYGPGGISVTRGRELVYSDFNSRTVNIVRDGKTETLITTPRGWIPGRLSCTRSRDVLVHVYKGKGPHTKNKIIRYEGKGIKQDINNDGQGNPIFKDGEYPLYMSENNNGDVCVSDVNADTVVVVDKTGRVRFRYDGAPARREKSFDPRGIVTDALSQIIVTDYNNDCLHVLDQDGQFLRCVDDCGLEKPVRLSVDSEGRLWVVSGKSGEIKVIEYL
uniref:Tripartite motif-containing protein 3-like n=1 Tax=Crassostrea virginica TaxID=6565 RepID=A0A8B8CAC3_CRAVI|nr:tripartite motif-containing protein 3-like [Crassostrea virginica]XP_022311685.1 tripartite motif-containing protein 3-like [Crassostrea virginica]XP_022311686.1 tripartite motif-containing protein 3-like [Crassostrea virginica]